MCHVPCACTSCGMPMGMGMAMHVEACTCTGLRSDVDASAVSLAWRSQVRLNFLTDDEPTALVEK